MTSPSLPAIIQGGMGVGVSSWRLARAVARTGQLGVVSGVALDLLLARRLQRGDPGGHVRRSLSCFPVPAIAQSILDRYFVPGGIPAGRPFRPVPRLSLRPGRHAQQLTVAANFVEVFLAKEGHGGSVGVNLLEKIQLGYLRSAFRRPDGGVGYRCPAEPVEEYARKGGSIEDTQGSRCLCNGLATTAGLGQQRRDGYLEPPLVTLGQDLTFLPHLTGAGNDYTAADVIAYLLRSSTSDITGSPSGRPV